MIFPRYEFGACPAIREHIVRAAGGQQPDEADSGGEFQPETVRAMLKEISLYDHYVLAAIAVGGTFIATVGLYWLSQSARFSAVVRSYRGVSPPFVGAIGVLFALNLAFLANDTWTAHDRALSAVFQEAGSLRTVQLLSRNLSEPMRKPLAAAIRGYLHSTTVEEWPNLAHRRSSPEAEAQLERLLSLLSDPMVAAALHPNVHKVMLDQAVQVRAMRELRLVLSQTHINPLKWMGVAFLGFLTLMTVAMIHVDQPRAELLAIMLFAASSAPTAAIVLVQGNPYQEPAAVTAEPLVKLLERPPQEP
jgi:hypothetical protein